jgi:hypothetical protein
MMDMRG